MQYIATYYNVVSTIGLSTQSKHASTALINRPSFWCIFIAFTHIIIHMLTILSSYHLNTLILTIITKNVFVGNNLNRIA